jgi:dTDP-4-dehydrorhamnose 3,5-epimerase-like enzyme
MIKILKNNFKDKRGEILDIFTKNPKDHCTLVTFNKSAIRGNHFHKKSTQYTYILSGKLTMYEVKVNSKGDKIGKLSKKAVKKNTLITHKKFTAHTFVAQEKSSILAFSDGLRGGKNYEKDTFRLNYKLN